MCTMADVQRVAMDLLRELRHRGAEAVDVSASVEPDLFSIGSATPTHTDGEVHVDYDGYHEWLVDAAQEVDGVKLVEYHTEPYVGGNVHVSGDLAVQEGTFTGTNPGGNADDSHSIADGVLDGEDGPDPHVEPGGTCPVRDENGIEDSREVEVWPVRLWEPEPNVPAVLMLRYVPHPSAHGLEWWAGYVRLVPPDRLLYGTDTWNDLLTEAAFQARERDLAGISYHDDGWVGWSGADQPAQMADVPVYSTVAEDSMGEIGHQEAGEWTKALAEAALDARCEVLG